MLLQSFRMSFYGAALWKLACSELHSLEVVFCLEFGIFPIAVHGALQSIYNLVHIMCGRLLQAAKLSSLVLVQHVFLSAI